MTETAIENQKLAGVNYARACALVDSREFRWFMRDCVIKRMQELDITIHDPALADEKLRRYAVDEWNALKGVLEWPDAAIAAAGNALGHAPRPPIDFNAP